MNQVLTSCLCSVNLYLKRFHDKLLASDITTVKLQHQFSESTAEEQKLHATRNRTVQLDAVYTTKA